MDFFISISIGLIFGLIPNYFLSAQISTLLKIENNWGRKSISFFSDAAKGIIIILLTKYLFSFSFMLLMLSLIIGVLAHSFFQGFKLRTRNGQFVALGGLSIFLPVVVLFWIIIWVISFIYKRNGDFSLISATFLTGLLSITSSEVLNNEYWYSDPTAASDMEFIILIGILFTLLLLTQIDKFKSYFLKGKSKDN